MTDITNSMDSVAIFVGHRLVAQIWTYDTSSNVVDILVTKAEADSLANTPVKIEPFGETVGTFKDVLTKYQGGNPMVVYKWDHKVTLMDNIQDRIGLLMKRLKFWKK
jgi:hypothetical protein